MTSRRTVPVLLLEDLENRGEVGDIVEVKPGYARNYLFPSGLATLPTADALAQVERAKKVAAEKRAARAAALADLATSLSGKSLTIEERASEEGHLFGSVGVSTIVAKLAEEGIAIEEKLIDLAEPIKELGIFNVPVKLGTGATEGGEPVELRIWVVETTES